MAGQGRAASSPGWRCGSRKNGTVLPNDGESVGEIEVRGPWITGSYYGDPSPDRFHDGWLRRATSGRSTAGLHADQRPEQGRDQVGRRVDLLGRAREPGHGPPRVIEAAVIAVPDERWSERPLVAVVLEEGAETSPDELLAFLTPRVSRWWLPERWAIIEEVPKTSVGKFDKKVLRARHAEGDLEVIEVDLTSGG